MRVLFFDNKINQDDNITVVSNLNVIHIVSRHLQHDSRVKPLVESWSDTRHFKIVFCVRSTQRVPCRIIH